jgi:hypothetical protein
MLQQLGVVPVLAKTAEASPRRGRPGAAPPAPRRICR